MSRKVEKLTGEFWNQTVYSPREQSDNAIPLKKGKSVEHYGHYMSPNSAFYSVIEHTDMVRGKKKRKVSVVGVPVNVSYGIKSDDDLLTYLQDGYVEPRILRSQVLKYQKIEWGGAEYYLTSPVEMINAQQLWLPEIHEGALRDGIAASEEERRPRRARVGARRAVQLFVRCDKGAISEVWRIAWKADGREVRKGADGHGSR